jgi:hypothetical protein
MYSRVRFERALTVGQYSVKLTVNSVLSTVGYYILVNISKRSIFT